jgi:hypothetical protein
MAVDFENTDFRGKFGNAGQKIATAKPTTQKIIDILTMNSRTTAANQLNGDSKI